jgi:hypothetical protein
VEIHQSQLPAVPKEHEKLRNHPFEALFLKAEADHLKSHKDMNSWTVISRKDPRAENHQILGCIWVYTYKTNKHGRFLKCKARVMGRNNQQIMLYG